MRWISILMLGVLFLQACSVGEMLPVTGTVAVPSPSSTPFRPQPSVTPPVLTPSPSVTPTPIPPVPNFAHIVMIVFENKEFGLVVGNPKMFYFNRLAREYTLLTQHYAVTHPSLPNYLALIGGDTFGIRRNCENCFIQAPNLADFIEASGRTWKSYQEDMPRPCFLGSTLKYAQKHNPFIYFDSIRLNPERCQRIVPLQELFTDLEQGRLPNFAFITPNLCNSAHDCGLDVADAWLKNLLDVLKPYLDAQGVPYLIVLTWDEGQGNHSCCGLPAEAGGRVATVLVSPQVRRGFRDDTPYTHYSLLKTILVAWNLPLFAHAAEENHTLIELPFVP
ncbi:MAG: alkaline phosphatase family protein [Anaerolineales bacterium]